MASYIYIYLWLAVGVHVAVALVVRQWFVPVEGPQGVHGRRGVGARELLQHGWRQEPRQALDLWTGGTAKGQVRARSAKVLP
jgi:hypothetical protein